jgi:hypothetical protein
VLSSNKIRAKIGIFSPATGNKTIENRSDL